MEFFNFFNSDNDLNKRKTDLKNRLNTQIINFQVTNTFNEKLQKTINELNTLVKNQKPRTELIQEQLDLLNKISSKTEKCTQKDRKQLNLLFLKLKNSFSKESGEDNFIKI